MVYDKFYTVFIRRVLSTIAILYYSYKIRVPPYAGIASILIMLLVIQFTEDEPGECYLNKVKRDYSPLTGKLEPSFWSWGCSRDLISEMLSDFFATSLVMYVIMFVRKQRQSRRAQIQESEISLKV